ncbi:MAG TPA: PEP-CTERM sorting domain-containing protein, partial [Bryobacteraceae bacterium]|nr:PEP-CTERM sorting domain-containing protein [Bryobacteraceae bacterium]
SFQANGFGATGFGLNNLEYSANGTSGGTVDIIYTYTPNSSETLPPSPEPSTWAIIGGGLLFLYYCRRRVAA